MLLLLCGLKLHIAAGLNGWTAALATPAQRGSGLNKCVSLVLKYISIKIVFVIDGYAMTNGSGSQKKRQQSRRNRLGYFWKGSTSKFEPDFFRVINQIHTFHQNVIFIHSPSLVLVLLLLLLFQPFYQFFLYDFQIFIQSDPVFVFVLIHRQIGHWFHLAKAQSKRLYLSIQWNKIRIGLPPSLSLSLPQQQQLRLRQWHR